jgi:CheY-like chemotaxis protein
MSSVRRLDLADLVAKVAQRSPGRGIGPVTFELEIADAPAWIRADAAQLRQVVEDLVANAGEALGGEHGKVTLACGVVNADRAFLAESYLADDVPEGEYAYVEVRDTGCGIDPEKLEKIFDPFYTTKFPGRGLGLAAVLGVVRSHRGALKVRSDPERGTSFQALFPRCDPPSLASASRPSRSLEGEGTGTILVVDDEEAVRAVTRRMLERDGFRVLSAAGGEEATVLLRQHRSEVAGVVLDMSMPKMDGEATFHQLRQIREDLPVLFVSGHSKQDLAHRLIGKVRADFLQKPFTLATLSEKLRAQL